MEFHGRSWKFQENNYYLVGNQASNLLASDFCVVVLCVSLSSFFRSTIWLVFLRKVLLPILYSHHSSSQQFFLLAGTGPGSLRSFVCLTPNILPLPQCHCYGYQIFLIIFSHFSFSIYLQIGILSVMLNNIPIY